MRLAHSPVVRRLARAMAACNMALLVMLLAEIGQAPTPAHAQSPGVPGAQAPSRDQSVVIRGNRRIEVDTILSYMQLQPGQPVTAEDLNLSVRRLFDTGLFRDVQVLPSDRALVVQVEENPSINVIEFEGNDALKDEDLEQIIALRPRFPFTVSAAEADAQAIIEIYRRTGRFGAEVEPVVIERTENRVDLIFEISEGALTGVNSIDFVGNQVFSDRTLRGAIDTTETGLLSQFFSTDIYDPDRLELDKELLRQYYLERGYADFTVQSSTAELAPDREGFFITFTVEEGPQYNFGTLDVLVSARGLNRDDFLELVDEDLTGTVYDATEVEEIANALTDLAAQKGFAFVQVRPQVDKSVEDLTIDVSFELIEGSRVFVERIEIEGNVATLDRVIRREIELVEGDAFDARKIREARRKIRALGYFSGVNVETEQGSADDRAVLKVQVQEQSTGSLSLGLGFSTSAGPIGNVSITERNFLGRGQVVQAQVTAAGDTQVYDFSFTEPRFLDRDLLVGFRTFFIQDDRSDESSFSINRAGVTPQIGFPLGEKTALRLRYNFARDDLDAASDASSAIQVDEGSRFKSSVGYSLTYDERNDILEPTEGFLVSLDQEFSGVGGDARFIRSRGSVKGWQGFIDDALIGSLELVGGAFFALGEDGQINDRFFLGGESFRGFADEGIGPRDLNSVNQDSLGGNFFAVARAEMSFPLGLPEELGIFGGVFIDAGTIFGLDRTSFPAINAAPATVIDDGADFRVAAGALLFVDTPFGPLELSFGVPIISEDEDQEELFRLSIGTRF